MEDDEIIGYVGGVLLAITSIPQIYRTLKTKKTDDLSIYFIFLQIITCIFFLTYGILINANPIMAANSILLVELLLLLFAKIKYTYNPNIVEREENTITHNTRITKI